MFVRLQDRLQGSYEETQSAIQQIFNDLEMTASFPFDKMVLSTPSNAFVLSPENMAALKVAFCPLAYKTCSESGDHVSFVAFFMCRNCIRIWSRNYLMLNMMPLNSVNASATYGSGCKSVRIIGKLFYMLIVAILFPQ